MVNRMVHQLAPDRVFHALGDERRAWLVDLLAQRDHTVSELAATLPISLQGTLKHLAVLEDAGVVSRSKQGRTVTVHLEGDRLVEAQEWLERTRRFWTRQLTSLAATFEEKR
jgi:DNA-binding transcriptional ArsR family regulator